MFCPQPSQFLYLNVRVCVFVYWICSGQLLLTLTDGQDRGAASVGGDSEGSGIMCAHALLMPFGH